MHDNVYDIICQPTQVGDITLKTYTILQKWGKPYMEMRLSSFLSHPYIINVMKCVKQQLWEYIPKFHRYCLGGNKFA